MNPSMILDRRTGLPLYVSTVTGWADVSDLTAAGWEEGDDVAGVCCAGPEDFMGVVDVYAGIALPQPLIRPRPHCHSCCEFNFNCADHHGPHTHRVALGPAGRPPHTHPITINPAICGFSPEQISLALQMADVSGDECGSWTPDVIEGAFWLVPHTATSAAEIAGFFDDIGKAFKDVGNAVGKAATSVVHTVGKLAKDAGKIAEKVVGTPLKVLQGALKVVTNNPLWDIARTGVSFIPGIGTAVSAGMAAAAAVGRGASITDIALAAAKGALPGGKLAEMAFDVATGVLLQGKGLDSAALSMIRNQLPGGDIAKGAFDVAAGMIMGKHANIGDAVMRAAKGALPNIPILRAGFEAASGLAKAKFAGPAIIQTVSKMLPRAAQPGFQAGLMAAKPKQITHKTVATMRRNIKPGPVRKAVEKSVATAIKAARVVQVHRDGRSVFLHALTTARRLAANDSFTKNKVVELQQKAKKGDRVSTTALAVLDVASKTLKAPARPGQAPAIVRHSGDGEPNEFIPMMLTAESGALGDVLRQGYQLWTGPRPRPTKRKLGFAW